ncbi:MAG: hypothetical protein ACJ8GN_09835 [Longimicrobiaceae bacterium]
MSGGEFLVTSLVSIGSVLLAWRLGARRLPKKVLFTHQCRQIDLPPGRLVPSPDRGDGITGEVEAVRTEAVLMVGLQNVGREPINKLTIVTSLSGATVDLQPKQKLPPIRLISSEASHDGKTDYAFELDHINVDSVFEFDLICLNGDCNYKVIIEAADVTNQYTPPVKFFRNRNSRWAFAKILGESAPAVPVGPLNH